MKKHLFRTIATASLLTVALAFVAPAGAEEGKKDVAKAEKPKKHEYTGEITAVDAVKKTVTVKNKAGDEKTFALTDKAKIVLKGKEAAELGDLKAGVKVTVSFTEDGATLTAHKIAQAEAMKKKEKPAEEKK